MLSISPSLSASAGRLVLKGPAEMSTLGPHFEYILDHDWKLQVSDFVEVHDSGPGLAGAAFAQALGRSQRLERDLDAAEGSGLGLSVANEIAQANGWMLSASSARRTGASLRVELPGAAVAAEKTKVLA